jgi:hypothetical protein
MVAYSSNFSAILALAGTGTPSLSSVLATGNDTGGTDLEVSSGDRIKGEDNGAGPGFDLVLDGGDAGGGVFPGGDVVVNVGSGSGGGAAGEFQVNGDTVITGDLTVTGTFIIPGFFSGTGSPEGVVVANIGDVYRRTDGGSGNSLYFKQATSGGNTGWVPAGPRVLDTFTSIGSAVYTTGRDFFNSASLGIKIFVTWNGLRQREGATEDFTITGTDEITFNTTPPTNDVIAIEYLPT